MKHQQQEIYFIQTYNSLVERDPGTVHRRKLVARYAYEEVLFDAALLYGGADQPYAKDDLQMLINASKKVKVVPISAIQTLDRLYQWLLDKPLPLTGDALEHFKAELGEALWLIWSVKQQRSVWIDADALHFLLKRNAAG
jgi:hypothetical protein